MPQQDAYEIALAQRYRHVVPMPFRVLAYAISIAFHPLLLLTYAYLLLALFNPYLFGEANTERVFSMTRTNPKAPGLWACCYLAV